VEALTAGATVDPLHLSYIVLVRLCNMTSTVYVQLLDLETAALTTVLLYWYLSLLCPSLVLATHYCIATNQIAWPKTTQPLQFEQSPPTHTNGERSHRVQCSA
jgi:hypothetical protein